MHEINLYEHGSKRIKYTLFDQFFVVLILVKNTN